MIDQKQFVQSILTSIIAALVMASPLLAADQDDVEIDEIIVTVTRMEISIHDVARSVTVVDKQRIQLATQQLGLDEALAGTPGVYMQNRYNFAQDLRIAIRGFGARSSFGIRGIKVIVDGIPERLPDGQASVDSIDLGSAQRIEVLRGPSSSLYGNASGGVIAIASELGGDTSYVEGRIAGGEYGYSQLQLKSVGKLASANVLFSVARTELDGYREHADARGTIINSRLGVPLGQTDELLFSLSLTDQPEADDPGGIDAAQAASDPSSARDRNVQFDSGEALQQQKFGVVYRRTRPAGELTLRNYYAWRDFSNKLPFVDGGAVDLDRFFSGVGAQYSVRAGLPAPLSLTFGVDYDRQDDDRVRFDNNDGVLGDASFDQNERVDSVGTYVQARYELTDAWSLHAGLRQDKVTFDVTDRFLTNGDDSGELRFDETSPSLAVNYRNNAGMLFASYNRSFETPSTTELANPGAAGGFNPSLNSQTADNFEVGYKYSAGDVHYELAWFTIDLNDELIPFELPAFPGRTFYSNAGNSSRDGVEAAVGWQYDSGWHVNASFTWSDFKFDDFVDDNGADFSGNRLPGLPERFAYLQLSYKGNTGFSALLEANYAGDLYANNANTVHVPSYTVANLRIAQEFDVGDWIIRPYAGINNLFDESYNSNIRINAFGGRHFEPAPDRHFYAGVVVNFSKSR